MKKCFVACQSQLTKHCLEDVSRLYAYPSSPVMPTKDEFIILDSGAYGLSQKGREIDAKHMFKLANYYLKHEAYNRFPVLAMAPDVFLNPVKTKNNFEFWNKHIKIPVVPIIQASKNRRIDLFSMFQQAKYYKNFSDTIFISNPGLRGREAKVLSKVVKLLKSFGVSWVHCLGAGWNAQDCMDWFEIGFDSIDSISYYTDAIRNLRWRNNSYETAISKLEPDKLAIINYEIANSTNTG